MSAEPSLPVWEDETSSSSQNQQHNAAAAAAAPAAAADQPGSSSSQNFYPEDPHVVSRRRQQQQQQQPPPPPQIVLADDADQVLSGNDFDQPEDPTSSSGSTLATRNDYGPALPSFVSAAPPEPVVMGPVLPPNFAKPDEEEDENSKSAPIGPVLPPSDSSRTSRDNDGEDGGYDKPSTSGSASNSAPSKKRSFPGCDLPPGFDLESNNTLGPSLPPGFEPDEVSPVVKKSTTTTTTTTRKVIGPALPPDLLPHFQEDGGENEEPAPPEGAMYGMELPPGFGAAGPDVPDEEDEDGEDEGDRQIGPSLPGENEDRNYVARLAAHLDAKKASEDGKKTQREAWMLEPPKALSAVGLKGATQFSQRSYSSSAEKEGRNAWTATPNGPSTSKEESNEEILERTANQARDEKQRKEADRLNAKRSESLYDQHAKGRKTGEGEKNALKPGERRPFDREKDMQGSLRKGNAEEARARMAQLASRFATGKQQQFL